jgi:hypothetical protein
MTVTARDYCIGDGEYCLDLEFHEVFTPEQAIAATVGRGTCEVDASLYWDVNPDDPYWEYELSCGHTVKWDDPKPPKFCPECGKEVRKTNGDDFRDVIY